MIMKGMGDFGKEELLLFLVSMLIQNYGQPFGCCIPECRQEIESSCEYIKQHFAEHIYLDQLCHHVGLSKSTLLRAFTKSKGITPYRYLETVRINEAKKLLGQGMAPVEVAVRTGFADQSHFTNYFTSFIGLTPGCYNEIFSPKKEVGVRRGKTDMDLQNEKCVMVIDENLPVGMIANAAAIMGITLGKEMPEVVGRAVMDRSGNQHLGIIEFPVPVLKGNAILIRSIREKLYEAEYSDLSVVDFSDLAQGCKTYREFIDKMGMAYGTELNYLGIAICGAKKKVNKLTGSMPLLR